MRTNVIVCLIMFGAVLYSSAGRGQNTSPFPGTGNNGIGTTSPDSLLEVGNASIGNSFHSLVGGGYAGLFENGYTGYGGNATLLWVKSANQNAASYHFLVQGNSLAEFVVQGNGRVGIGTSAPAAPLNIVYGNVSAGSQIYNGLTVQPSGGSAYGANGASILLSSVTNYVNPTTNSNIQPVAGLWSSLDSGGSGAINYGGSLVLGSTLQGNALPTEQMRINYQGYVGIGTASPSARLEVNGTTKLDGSVTYPDGSVQSVAWNGILSGGDYAESVDITGDRVDYEPGDVLVIDPAHEGCFLKATNPYSTAVTGIYSTRPGALGRRQFSDKTNMKDEVPMAMTGIVPTKVTAINGAIKPGDLLVTSSEPGYAMKGTDHSKIPGAVVGKALGHLDSGSGVIEVVVTLQ
jgi:hypothetical protein